MERNGEQRRAAMPVGQSPGGQLEQARQYIDRLAQEPAAEAVPKLVAVLRDESWYLRERAGEVLLRFGTAAAPEVEALLAAGLWYTRAAALEVLGRLAAPSSLRAVLGFLHDKNRAIAEASARAVFGFCRQGRAVAVAKLLQTQPAEARAAILPLLRRVAPEDFARLERLMAAQALLGAPATLTGAQERRLAEEAEDRRWGISWGALRPGEGLPEVEQDVGQWLREASAE